MTGPRHVLALLLLAAPGLASLPGPDRYRDLDYRVGPAVLLTRPAGGAAPDLASPPPRETHRRVRCRVDGTRLVCRIHQVFFNASSQAQDVLLLAPDPGEGQLELDLRSRWIEQPLPRLPLDAAAAAALTQEWAVLGGNPGPLTRYRLPVLAHGPFRVAPRVYLKMDWRVETRLEPSPDGLAVLAVAPGGRPEKPLATSALEVDLPLAFRHHAFSPTHRLVLREGEPGRLVVGLARDRVDATEPFLLLWPARAGRPGVGCGSEGPEAGRPCLALIPPRGDPGADASPRRAWVLALDTGGSLRGEPYERLQGTVMELLDQLGPRDLFEVVPFALDPQPMHRTLVPATPEARARTRETLAQRRPYGTVNFEAALLTALEIAAEAPADASRAVLLFTDGRPTVGELDAAAILDQHVGPATPVYPVARGPDADYYLLEQLARLSGGSALLETLEDGELRTRLETRLRSRRGLPAPSVRLDGEELPTSPRDRLDGPYLLTFRAPAAARALEIEGARLALDAATPLGPLAEMVEERRRLGRSIWDALLRRGTFPGGAESFKLLGLVPGTPRPRILATLSDGVGPLGRARVLALAGLLDQGTFEPVDPGPEHAWSGNRFFLREEGHRWTESGLPRGPAPERVPLGSARHMALTSDPALAPHLGLGRSVGLFLDTTRTARVEPEELP